MNIFKLRYNHIDKKRFDIFYKSIINVNSNCYVKQQ